MEKKICEKHNIEKHFKARYWQCDLCIKESRKKCEEKKKLEFLEKKNNPKTCSKCNIEKIYDDFEVGRNQCNVCYSEYRKEYSKKWREINREKNLQKKKDYYYENRENILKQQKKFKDSLNEIEKEELLKKKRESSKKYRKNNLEKKKEYYQRNKHIIKEKTDKPEAKEKRRKWSYVYKKKRLQEDDLFKTQHKIRGLIHSCFKRKNHKKTGKTVDILGCTIDEFKTYIESKFEPWMNWSNNGKYKFGEVDYGWDLDHIIPIDTAKTVEDIIKLCHYTNFQPLCSYVNRWVKRNKII